MGPPPAEVANPPGMPKGEVAGVEKGGPKAPPEAPPSAPPKADAPGYLDRVIAWAESKSREGRAPRPADSPGARFGGSEVNVYDVIAAAAKVVRGGVRTAAKVREAVREMLGRDDPETARKAWRLVKASETRDGVHDDGRFEVGVAQLLRREAERSPSAPKRSDKAIIRETTGQTPPPAEVSQRDALAGQLAAEAKGAARVERTRAAQEKRDARRLNAAVGIERDAAARSAAIQAGMAKLELSKAGKAARAAMAEERARSKADRAAAARDAAETLRATLEVAGDQRKAITKAMMDLPPEVRGRRDMLALVESAETPKDAKAAAEIIQQELHRQSIRDDLRSMQNLRSRKGGIDQDLKKSIRASINRLKSKLDGLKTEWTVRAALAGRAKGEPIVVRTGKSLAETAQAATDAGEVADAIRVAVHQAQLNRKIRLGERSAATKYVTENVVGHVNQIPSGAKASLWGNDRAPNTKILKRWSKLGWTPQTLARNIDGTLGSNHVGYAEQLLFRDPLEGEKGVARERQTATDTLDGLAKKDGFKSWADFEDFARSEMIEAPWSGPGSRMTVAEALYILGQDTPTLELIDGGARMTLGAEGNSGGLFHADAERRARLLEQIGRKNWELYEKAKAAIYEGQFRDRVMQTLMEETGTAPPLNERYQPRQTREQWKAQNDPNKTDPLQIADFVNEMRLDKASFTQERTAGKNTIFVVRDPFQVMNSHIDRAAKLIHLARVVRQAKAVFQNPDVRGAVERKLGRQITRDIDRHLSQMSMLEMRGANSGAAGVMRSATRDVGRAMTQLNVASWLRQYGSLAMAGHDYGMTTLAKHMPEGVKTSTVERMVNSDPLLRQRYEADTATAGIRSATGEGGGEKTAARSKLFDREQARLGMRQLARAVRRMDIRGAIQGNRQLWEAIRIQNRPDSHVAATVWSIELAKLKAENPNIPEAQLEKQAGERTALWVHRRMNTSSLNSASTFAKIVRENPVLSSAALFTSDRTKMWNLMLEARAADGGKPFGKNQAKAWAAVALNAAWSQTVGRLYRNVLLGAIASAIYGKSETDEEKKDRLLRAIGVGVLKDMVGIAPGGTTLASSLEAIAQQGGLGGAAQQSLIDNPVTSTADQTLKSVVGVFGTLLKSTIDTFGDGEEDPSVKAFNKAEQQARKFSRAFGQLSDGMLTFGGLPLAPLRRDVATATMPGADELQRASVAIKEGRYGQAKDLMAGRAKRMLAAGIDPEKVRQSLERTIAARLNRGLKKGQDDDAMADNASTARDLAADAMP